MKRIFTNVVVIVLVTQVYALFSQTITADWAPKIDDEAQFISGLILGEIDPGDEGQNILWDYSGIGENVINSPIRFVTTEATSFADEFPAANLAAISVGDSTNFVSAYYTIDDNTMSILGAGISETSRTVYGDPQMIMQFPFDYEDVFEDTYSGQTEIGGDFAFTTYFNAEAIVAYDAQGTIITPEGTFEDVIRIRNITFRVDSSIISGTITRTTSLIDSYSWYSDNLGQPIANLSITETFSETILEGIDPIVGDTTTIGAFSWRTNDIISSDVDFESDALSTKLFSAYPNPVVDEMELVIHNAVIANGQFILSNIVGQGMHTEELQLRGGKDNYKINLPSTLPSGLYYGRLRVHNRSQTIPIQINRN